MPWRLSEIPRTHRPQIDRMTSGQPTSSGTRMRNSRFFTNPPRPFRCSIIRANSPAIRKKLVMRNTWMAKNSTARAVLLDGSAAGEITNAGRPGRNDRVA